MMIIRGMVPVPSPLRKAVFRKNGDDLFHHAGFLKSAVHKINGLRGVHLYGLALPVRNQVRILSGIYINGHPERVARPPVGVHHLTPVKSR